MTNDEYCREKFGFGLPTPMKVSSAPMTSGVIQTQPLTLVPGSAEPMKPVRVKTVQVKAGTMKLAIRYAGRVETFVT